MDFLDVLTQRLTPYEWYVSDSLLIPFLDVYVTWSLIAFLPLVHLELLTVLKCGIEHRETNLCLLSWEPISLHCIDTLKERENRV